MKPVSIIGDCHLARVGEHNNILHDFELNIWARAGLKAWGLDWKTLENENSMSSGPEKGPGEPIPFNKIKNDGIVMIWIGYVDIRQFLPKYKNAEVLVKKYVEDAVKYFNNCDLVFIEPLGQFDKMYLKYEGISPSYTFEQRVEQNKNFLNYLNKYCKVNNIDKIIKQDEIFDALGTDVLDSFCLRNIAPHPADALKEDLNKKIYDLFIKKIYEFQN